MLLIADSGSTNCDWLLVADEQATIFHTPGLNPLFVDEKSILELLNESELTEIAQQIKFLYFFGAGCSSPERKLRIANPLRKVFSNAMVLVDHDMKAAVLSTCGKEKGIVCILGTGSNSCFYDGKNILKEKPSLGFMLGDEGSGCAIGRELLQSFLYKKFPENLSTGFEKSYQLDVNTVLSKLYAESRPNAFLASLVPFASANIDHPFIDELIRRNFRHFVEEHVCCFENYTDYPVHFIGSVAYNFQNILKDLAKEFGFKTGEFLQRPIFNLGEFLSEQLPNNDLS